MERRAASGAGLVATVAIRLALKRYQAPVAIAMSVMIPAPSSASRERFFGAGFASAVRLRLGRDAHLHRKDPDRPFDVLELRRTQIGDFSFESAAHLTIGVFG